MNRIEHGIELAQKRIEEKLNRQGVEELSRTLNMEPLEYVRFQEFKSLAASEGTLSPEEAQTVYGYLGNTPEQFNRQPLAVKVVLTRLFATLLATVMEKRGVA